MHAWHVHCAVDNLAGNAQPMAHLRQSVAESITPPFRTTAQVKKSLNCLMIIQGTPPFQISWLPRCRSFDKANREVLWRELFHSGSQSINVSVTEIGSISLSAERWRKPQKANWTRPGHTATAYCNLDNVWKMHYVQVNSAAERRADTKTAKQQNTQIIG